MKFDRTFGLRKSQESDVLPDLIKGPLDHRLLLYETAQEQQVYCVEAANVSSELKNHRLINGLFLVPERVQAI